MKFFIKIFLIVVLITFGMSMFAEDKEEKPNVKAYGYVKLDAIYETGRASHGNFAIWAKDPGESNGLFHLTANQTRFGLALSGFSFGKFKVTGKLEVDFFGGGAENKAYNYMRHAFLKISDGSLTIIAGQYWDLICPLNAPTLNYPVLWGAGNIGYRRPQLRIRKDIKAGKHLFTLEGGIFRTIAGDYDGDGIEDGSAGGPTFQGRVAGKFALGSNASLQLGVSGHYGKTKGEKSFTTNSLNGDLVLVISPKFKILAEYFSGQKLATFLGGIVRDFKAWPPDEELKTKGFFVSIVAALAKNISVSAGYGVDDPDDENLGSAAEIGGIIVGGVRSKNSSFYGNLILNLSKSVKIGFEISNWETEYLGAEKQKTLRLQNSWILSF